MERDRERERKRARGSERAREREMERERDVERQRLTKKKRERTSTSALVEKVLGTTLEVCTQPSKKVPGILPGLRASVLKWPNKRSSERL